MELSIDRRAGLSLPDFEREYASRRQPVILTDATSHWPASRKWNFDFFETRFDAKAVRFDDRDWKIGELVRRLRQGPDNGRSPYLSMVKLDEQFPELWNDVGQLAVTRRNRLRSRLLPPMMRLERGSVAVFIGTQGSGFRLLHWDSTKLNVFISQILGAKEFVLFRPEDTPHLYPRDDNVYDTNHSRLPDAFNVDLERFPEFRNARPIRVTVEQGETLFLPAGWWHATYIDQPNIAIAESALDAFNWWERNRWFQDRYRLPGTGFWKRYVLRHVLSGYLALVHVLMRANELRR